MSSDASGYLVEFEPVEGRPRADVVVRFGPGGAFVEGDEFGGRRKLPRGEWVTSGTMRVRIRRAEDLLEAGQVNSANWTRPELLVSTVDGGRVRRLRSVLPTDDGSDLLIGRSGKKNDIVLSDEHVSRRHVRIVVRGGRHMVEDLGSRWGTYVNDARVESATPLSHGDEIRLGKSVMRFVKFSDGLDLASVESGSAGVRSEPARPSWRPDPTLEDSMTITATTLLTAPEEPELRPRAETFDDADGVSISQKVAGWMRKKK